MVENLKLSTKFTLLLVAVFIAGVLAGGLVLWRVLQQRVQNEVTAQGVMLIETMNAVRTYTSNHIRPLLADDLANSPAFIAETVPAFSARTVFEQFRQKPEYSNFWYKEAAANPTNPRDLADEFETAVLRQLQMDTTLKEVAGYRTLFGNEVYYSARPLAITSESCLACHSDPAVAPASLIATYGDQNGFGWQLNQIIAAQIIYVPANQVFDATLRSFVVMMSIFVAIFALIIILMNWLLRRYVIEPVGEMGVLAEKISKDEVKTADFESGHLSTLSSRADEIGDLAQLFQKMAREVYARTELLKQQVQQLRIEIDEAKRQQQVAEVTDSTFFRELKAQAGEIRKRRREEHEDAKEESPEEKNL